MCVSFSSCPSMLVVVRNVLVPLLQSSGPALCMSSIVASRQFVGRVHVRPCRRVCCHCRRCLSCLLPSLELLLLCNVVMPASSNIVVVYPLLRLIS